MAQDNEPRIIVDDDWKLEAQREKERLEQEAQQAEPQGEMQAPSVLELVQMIAMQASIGLGGYQDPASGHSIPPNMNVARHFIDLLAVLIEKTKGNLDEQEKQVMDGLLSELRMAFVQVAGVGAGGAGGSPEQPTPRQ